MLVTRSLLFSEALPVLSGSPFTLCLRRVADFKRRQEAMDLEIKLAGRAQLLLFLVLLALCFLVADGRCVVVQRTSRHRVTLR